MKLDNTDPTYGTVAAGHVPDLLYHGTKAALAVGDLLSPGFASNYEDRRPMSWIYMSGLLEPAIWGAELAAGEGRGRVFIVEPTGAIEDDPNLTTRNSPATSPCPTARASRCGLSGRSWIGRGTRRRRSGPRETGSTPPGRAARPASSTRGETLRPRR